ncbi:MAG TPA: HAD-IA family hydrolase, partial [Candidatus Nanopelagicales bacterium]|nr:HAD-IA family hydrolase [Candidatus Nanopelagicales bacterium]
IGSPELAGLFTVSASTDEVAAGKPAPDVYLAVIERLEAQPERCLAVEDSGAGLRSASAAGMRLVAVPQPGFPQPPDALALADVVLDSLDALSVDLAATLIGPPSRR